MTAPALPNWHCTVCKTPIEDLDNGITRILWSPPQDGTPHVHTTHFDCEIPGVDHEAGYSFPLQPTLERWIAWSLHLSDKTWFTKQVWREYMHHFFYAQKLNRPRV